MGKFDGKQLTGLIGPLITRKGSKGVTIIQTAPRKYKQTKATKQASNLFAQGSTLAGTIRRGLQAVIIGNYDGSMINRFSTPVREVINQCYDKTTEKFHFTEDSFSRLTGFEFNIKSALINSLWVSAEMKLDGNSLVISLPEIKIGEQLKFPVSANTCTLTIAVTLIALQSSLHKAPLQQTVEISTEQQILPAQEFTFEVPDGCLCVAGIGLKYFSLRNNIKTVMNTETFNPGGVCGAIITPGTFVEPPRVVTPQGTRGSEWMSLDKLKLQ